MAERRLRPTCQRNQGPWGGAYDAGSWPSRIARGTATARALSLTAVAAGGRAGRVWAQRVRTPGGGASGDDWIDGGIGVAWAVSGGVPGITTTRVPTWTRL
jgi:hypothetical protein